MRKILVFVFAFAVCSAYSQDVWKQRHDALQKELELCKKNQPRQTTSTSNNDGQIRTLREENQKLQSENASLREEIARRDGRRADRIGDREQKEKTFVTDAFKDPMFKAFLIKHYDKNNDGKISQAEAEEIEKLDITKQKITSVAGIENLINLKTLVCPNNKLTTLNLSKNTLLETLICDRNAIYSLDISQCSELISLDCSRNKLGRLDISKNPKLTTVNCANNSLTGLTSKNPELKTLNCNNNKLTSLDVSNNPQLENLNCSNNQISNLNVSNCMYLKKIECQKNAISTLNVSTNMYLADLDCSRNKLSSLSVENNKYLKSLNCSFNQLTSLNVKNNAKFDLLDCRSNPNLLEVKTTYGQQFKELKKGKKTLLNT